jgi:xanthosine utilization system XapX-like protein
VDALVVAGFLWLAEHTSPPPLPLLVLLLVTIVGVLVGPWAYLATRRLAGEATAGASCAASWPAGRCWPGPEWWSPP